MLLQYQLTNNHVILFLALFKVIPRSLSSCMVERRQLLKEQCLTKPPNLSFIEEADFSPFIVIEKLKFVFCFIPKVSCTTWKRSFIVQRSTENKEKNTSKVAGCSRGLKITMLLRGKRSWRITTKSCLSGSLLRDWHRRTGTKWIGCGSNDLLSPTKPRKN